MRRKAILLTIRGDNAEMEELLYALGAELVGTMRQRRSAPDPQFFLGRGKVDEVVDLLRVSGASLVVVHDALKPNQIFNLQRFLAESLPGGVAADGTPLEVYDRTRLILEIFSERAHSQEARLQVELAKLHYETPLVKESIHLAKKGERAGFLAGGDYEVTQYLDMIKRRMARIRRELDRLRGERDLRRKHRRRGGYHLVSLAGYTNAGKSSLLRALADDGALVENRYFSTLSTRTRRASSDRRDILVTDTVGFIEDLPPWLVEAFHATLEEIALADVTLLVVDASDREEEVARRLRASLGVLHAFRGSREVSLRRSAGTAAGSLSVPGGGRRGATRGGGRGPHAAAGREAAELVVVLNKVDAVSEARLGALVSRLREDGLLPLGEPVTVSARSGEGIDALYARIYELLPEYDLFEAVLPLSSEAEGALGWLRAHADVGEVAREDGLVVTFESELRDREDVVARIAEAGGRLRLLPREGRPAGPVGDPASHARLDAAGPVASAVAETAASDPHGGARSAYTGADAELPDGGAR